MPKAGKYVLVWAPHEAWDVLIETLKADSESGSFDDKLQDEIEAALDSVEAIDHSKRGRVWWWTLVIPQKHWETIAETLGMDMVSKWIDKKLRRSIERAYSRISVEPWSPRDWSPRIED